ncbi:hypothetical protein [Nocardioides zeae]|uniref:Condensation domain-containing protein n=1 Tax=Nocardioides zeae TaxID=1457234 RepID=A0AAJ1X2B4_9ACTN|nr:hypothetical protein [Nocardioides zeae]MDQ1106448.1 hypothetical protein [Nocardioides zeae]
MRLEPMSSWRLRPGRVWHLEVAGATRRAAAAAPVSPGGPSFLQADHLAAYARLRADGGTHRAWTGGACRLAGPVDTDALARAVAGFLAQHEGQRTTFDLRPGDAPVRRLVPDDLVRRPGALTLEPVTVPPDLARADADPGAFTAWVHETTTAHFSEVCTPDDWPGLGMVVVEQPAGADVFWGCDHAFTDAWSQLLLAGELGARYAAERGDSAAVADVDLPGPTEAGGFVAYAADERARAAAYGPDAPEVAVWREALTTAGGMPSFPLPLGLDPGESAPVELVGRELVRGADRLAALDAGARELGARVPSALVGACAAAELRLAGRERYVGLTVLGTRDGGPHSRAQGWFCNFAPLRLDLGAATTYRTLFPAAEATFRRAREVARMPVHVALGALVADGTLDPATLGSPQLMSYLDLRWLPAAGATAGAAAAAAHRSGFHFTGMGRTRNASMWFNRDHERLYVFAQVPATTEARASIERYLDAVTAVLDDVLAGRGADEPLGVTA